MSVNGPISRKQCYYEMDYSFYSFYWLDSLEILLDHNSTYYRSLSKNSDVKPCISHCDPKTSNIRHTPSFDLLTDKFSKRVSFIRRALYQRQDGNLQSFHPNSYEVIGTQFCSCFNSTSAMACAQICSNITAWNGTTMKQNFLQIWIAM